MSRKTLSPASVFERVLRAHETGGVTFKDVRAQLKELLAAGASPKELLDTLRRQEQWEPLPESARVEVVGLIDEAIRAAPRDDDAASTSPLASESVPPPASVDIGAAGGGELREPDLPPDNAKVRRAAPSENIRSLEARIAGQQADYTSLTRSYERAREAELAANTRALALDAQVTTLEASRDVEQRKAQQTAVTLAEALSANDALHARAEASVREARDARSEIRELGELLQARDAVLAEAKKSLAVGASELAALQQQRAQAATLLAERDAALAALQSEHAKGLGARDAEISQLRQVLGSRDAALAEKQTSFDTRGNELDAVQSDLQAARSALAEAQRSVGEREAGREAELQKVRAALLAEQTKSQHAAQSTEQLEESIRGLRDTLAARDAALAEVQSSMGSRFAGLQALQSDLQASRSALAEAQRSGSEREAAREAELQKVRAALLAEQAKALQSDLQASRLALAEAQRSGSEREAAREVGSQAEQQSQETIRELRALLAARDASLADAQRFLGTRAVGLEALQSDLQAARSALAEAQRLVGRRAVSELETPIQENVAASLPAVENLPFLAPIAVSARSSVGATRATSPGWMRALVAIGIILLGAVAAFMLNHRAPLPAPVAASLGPVVPKPGSVIRDCLTCPEITVLPAGTFSQGSAGPGVGPALFEKPLHVVTIGSAIGMATNLVSVDEFQQFITASGWQSQGCTTYDGEWKARPRNNWANPGFAQTGKHPVTCASWNDAQAYAKWLSAKAGHTYRLPSASEWEYGARAGGEAVAPWTADSAACANANVADESAVRRYPGWAAFKCDDGYVYTSPVGSFKANAFGLKDMLGNVFQWTEDCWHPDYVGAPSDGSPRTDGACDEHELRGGSWFTTPAYVRANYRNHFTADYRSSTVGIRLVRDMGA